MRSRLVQFRDDVGDGVADTRDIGEGARRYDTIQRLRQRGKAVRRARIGLGAIRITAAQ